MIKVYENIKVIFNPHKICLFLVHHCFVAPEIVPAT